MVASLDKKMVINQKSGDCQYQNDMFSISDLGIAVGFRRSTDLDETDGAGQDYIAVRYDDRSIVGVLADGVGRSFFGDLAAKGLSEHLINPLWEARERTIARDDFERALKIMEAEVHGDVADFQLPASLPGLLIKSLEKKRPNGSQAVFTAFIFDAATRRLTLYQVGDTIALVHCEGVEPVEQVAAQRDGRWSTAGKSVHNLEVQQFECVSGFVIKSDGASSEWGTDLQDGHLNQPAFTDMANVQAGKDDVSFISVTPVSCIAPQVAKTLEETKSAGDETGNGRGQTTSQIPDTVLEEPDRRLNHVRERRTWNGLSIHEESVKLSTGMQFAYKVEGGSGPYTWQIVDGQGLPIRSLVLNQRKDTSAVTITAGSSSPFKFEGTLVVNDSENRTARKQLTGNFDPRDSDKYRFKLGSILPPLMLFIGVGIVAGVLFANYGRRGASALSPRDLSIADRSAPGRILPPLNSAATGPLQTSADTKSGALTQNPSQHYPNFREVHESDPSSPFKLLNRAFAGNRVMLQRPNRGTLILDIKVSEPGYETVELWGKETNQRIATLTHTVPIVVTDGKSEIRQRYENLPDGEHRYRLILMGSGKPDISVEGDIKPFQEPPNDGEYRVEISNQPPKTVPAISGANTVDGADKP